MASCFAFIEGLSYSLDHAILTLFQSPSVQIRVPSRLFRSAYAFSATFLPADQGALAAWGEGDQGQLGHKEAAGSTAPVQPKIVKGTREQRFVRVACGAAHTLALTGEAAAHAWEGDSCVYLLLSLLSAQMSWRCPSSLVGCYL